MKSQDMHREMQQVPLTPGRGRVPVRGFLTWALLIVLAAAGATVIGAPPAWGAESEIVARVNGEPITRGELQRVLSDRPMRRRLQGKLGARQAGGPELERLALQKLINRSLILQEASRRGITVPAQDLHRRVAVFRRHFKNASGFAEWMKARGLDEKSLREALRTELLMASVRAAVVEAVRFTEEQVQEYYEAHQDDLKTPEEVRLRIIAVTDRAAAEEIIAALKAGADFERLAQERSLESRVWQGGDTGWVSPDTLPLPLQEAAGALKTGETGGPVQTDAEVLIVRLDERKPVRPMTVTEARLEIEQGLRRAKRDELFQAWVQEQEKTAKIEVFLQPESLTTETAKRSAISNQLSASEVDVSVGDE